MSRAAYYLTLSCPTDTWRVVTERPAEGEVIELDVTWWSEARAEADRLNGTPDDGQQGVLGL